MATAMRQRRTKKRKHSCERIVLNAERSRRFVEALLAPPRPPTPRMLAAMRAYKASVKSDLD
ncbi:MAG TPA: DUF1778 domain-containing protein [Candidatus Acidoferrum sp.]|nr:DUF1778 domain-containing protein [Candidatus Acidoferrum sp.]